MTDPPDGSDPEAAPAQARALRRLVTRHAVDTRPLAIAPYRRLLVGQGMSFVCSPRWPCRCRSTR